MPLFKYKGRNPRGEAVTGYVEAVTADAVANLLFNTGVTPVDIVTANANQDLLATLRVRFTEGKVGLDELIFFCRQMHTLLKAGVPVMQALRGLRNSTKNPALARVIGNLSDSLDAGLDFTAALTRHPKVFPPLFVSLVQVGETTGSLEEAFLQLVKYQELEKETRMRIKSATRYPKIVLFAMAVAVGVINAFVIPAFAKLYSGFRAELPLPTKILIAMSDFTVDYWWVVLGIIALVFSGLHFYINTTHGRYRWHRLKIRVPVIGPIIYQATLGRFARALAITAKTGVPIVQGLTVISKAVDNDFISARVLQMRDGVERGESIMRTAAATGLFPPLVLQMIAVGEDAGAIDKLMEEVAGYYEQEVDYALKNISTAIEPILIVGLGVMVLILALGVFLPMWDLGSVAIRR